MVVAHYKKDDLLRSWTSSSEISGYAADTASEIGVHLITTFMELREIAGRSQMRAVRPQPTLDGHAVP